MSVALGFFGCCCIALAVFTTHLYYQIKNKEKEPRKDYSRMSSAQEYYVDDY